MNPWTWTILEPFVIVAVFYLAVAVAIGACIFGIIKTVKSMLDTERVGW
jgi:hypothetical protein